MSISVADQVSGIPESLHQRVFDKFFRIHEESAQSGVGLGLSICRAIVDAHAGKIYITNRDIDKPALKQLGKLIHFLNIGGVQP